MIRMHTEYDSQRFKDGHRWLLIRAAAERLGVSYSALKQWIYKERCGRSALAAVITECRRRKWNRMLAAQGSSARPTPAPLGHVAGVD